MNELVEGLSSEKQNTGVVVETPRADGSTLWEIRTEEQPYAFLSDKEIKKERKGNQPQSALRHQL
mgnify:CR=1 FL=1